MHAIPLIRQYVYAQVTSTLELMNADVERTLAKHSIPDWRDLGGNEVVPVVHFMKALEAGARATGEETFSMRVSGQHGLDSFADFGKAIQSGITVYDAMNIACRLIATQVPTLKWWVSKKKGGVLLCRKQSVQSPGLEQPLMFLERYTMLLFVNIIRTGAGPDWSPTRGYLSTQKDDVFSEWSEFEDASIVFDAPCSAIFVPNEVLFLPVRDQPIPPKEKNAVINNQFARDKLGENFVHDLRLLLKSLLHQKSANLRTLSEVSLISQRTLQRRLADKGQSFQMILDQARFQNAVEILENPGATVSETSELLGYEHPQHFIRAFRKWAGITPGQYKQIQARTI